MLFQLKRYRITSRIYLGFAMLIALTIALALFSTARVSSVQSEVNRLLALADDTTHVVEADRLLETLLRSAFTYKTSQDDAMVQQFEDARARIRALMQASATKLNDSGDQPRVFQDAVSGLDTLEPQFRELVALGSRIKAARAKLFSGGDDLTSATERLVTTAGHSGQAAAVVQADSVESAMLLVRVANWRFLATHDPQGPAAFATNAAKAEKVLAQFEQHVRGGDFHEVLTEVSARLTAYRQSFVEISTSMAQADAVYATDVATALTKIQTQLDSARSALVSDVTARQADTQQSANRKLSNAVLLQVIVGLGLVALGVGLALVIAASIVKPLSRMTQAMTRLAAGELDTTVPVDGVQDEIAAMGRAVETFKANELARRELHAEIAHGAMSNTQQIAATAKEQQATASEVAATVTEIGATSKEISATSRELVRTVGEVATVAEHSAKLASSGQTGLSHMETTMRGVMDAAGAINAKLAVLNEKAGNINQVVVTITKVADQTNLLSLNAAIEAEKAGEYGRGFSVVATEIRRLADQTAVATYDIEQMVKEIQSAVAAGVMGMDKFSEEVRRGMHEVQQVSGQLSQIIQQVQTLAPRVEVVNEGMQAQATGAEQITQALAQLNEATQQTVESLRQQATAIDELNKVSVGLRSGVSRGPGSGPGALRKVPEPDESRFSVREMRRSVGSVGPAVG
jgi:methyl-accepting chemotaxis protein WspA